MIPSTRIIDDAREKIAKELYWQSFGVPGSVKDIDTLWDGMHINWQNKYLKRADQILALSGTTDIECPECGGSGHLQHKPHKHSRYLNDCPKCDNGVIKHKWEVSVTLENGELPENIYKNHDWAEALHVYHATQQDMRDANYRQVVE